MKNPETELSVPAKGRRGAAGTGQVLGGKIQDYGKGQQLLHEGDTIGQLGIVLEGEVRIVRIDMDGNERLFQKLIPSYMLGADIVCTPSRQSPYSAYCSQDAKV